MAINIVMLVIKDAVHIMWTICAYRSSC